MDDTIFFEKNKREDDERKYESAYKFASHVHSMLDEEYQRKVKLFEKWIKSSSEARTKYNKLGTIY